MNNEIRLDIPTPTNKSMALYLLFMLGQMISLLGSGIVQFVLLWWIAIIYRSGFYLSLGAVFGFGPTLIVGLFAGVYVDRWNRKIVLAIVDTMEAFLSIIVAYVFWIDPSDNFVLYTVFMSMTIRAIFQGFHVPAIQAIIPLMIPKKHLSRVNSIEYLSNGILNAMGPLVAAVLLSIFGLGNVQDILLIDAATFFIAVIPLFIITIPSVLKLDEMGNIKQIPFKEEFKEGFLFIKEKKGLLALLSAFATTNFFLVPLFVLLPLIVSDPNMLNGNAGLLATALAISEGGGIIASIIMTIKNPFSKNTNGVFFSLMLANSGSLLVILGAISRNMIMFLVGMLLIGSTTPLANVSSQNIWQTVVPPEKMGRIFSVRRTIAQISSPAAMILTGLLVGFIGISELIFITIIAHLIVLLYIYFMTGFTHVEEDLGILNETLETLVVQVETVPN